MLKPENINTIKDAQNYVESVINDFEGGISDKDETIRFLYEYTKRIVSISKPICPPRRDCKYWNVVSKGCKFGNTCFYERTKTQE